MTAGHESELHEDGEVAATRKSGRTVRKSRKQLEHESEAIVGNSTIPNAKVTGPPSTPSSRQLVLPLPSHPSLSWNSMEYASRRPLMPTFLAIPQMKPVKLSFSDSNNSLSSKSMVSRKYGITDVARKTYERKNQHYRPLERKPLRYHFDDIEVWEEPRYNLPSFSMERFMIYLWPVPWPQDMTNLTEGERDWKVKTDLLEAELDKTRNDGSDDWQHFSGNPNHYPSEQALCSAIARTFVTRAKRAFRSGASWLKFMAEERSIDPLDAALVEKKAKRNDNKMEDCLDQSLRFAILESIAVRLCNEIWSEEYSESDRQEPMPGRDPYREAMLIAQCSTNELHWDLEQYEQRSKENEARPIGGLAGMTALETVVRMFTYGAREEEDLGEPTI